MFVAGRNDAGRAPQMLAPKRVEGQLQTGASRHLRRCPKRQQGVAPAKLPLRAPAYEHPQRYLIFGKPAMPTHRRLPPTTDAGGGADRPSKGEELRGWMKERRNAPGSIGPRTTT